jgi:hypothetical protein
VRWPDALWVFPRRSLTPIRLLTIHSAEAYFFRYINNDEPTERTYSARFVITKKFRTKGVVAATTVRHTIFAARRPIAE